MQVTTSAVQQDQTFTRPYAPSWFDHWRNWVDRLPIPAWGFYVLLGGILLAAISAVASSVTS